VRNIKTWIRKRENTLIELISILSWIIIGAIAFFLYFYGQLDLLTLLQVIFSLIVALLPLYLYLLKKRDQTMLISFTSKYLLEKDEAKIDELLGILIAGKWKKLKIDPIEEFFNCLKKISIKSDFEMRRRVAEALPALYKIDLEKSKEIVEILRKDWDNRWKSDNRRRTVESLSYILKEDKEFVKENLQIIDGDEIFTIIAVVEVLDMWRAKINKKEAENLFENLMKEIRMRKYGNDEITTISELWNLLHLIRSNPFQAIDKFEKLKDTSNIYIQICIVRNLKYLCKKFPERILNLMEYFIQKDKHKNVRRPIAKEDSVECLLSLLHDKRFSRKVKEIIWKLINDEDDIIRLATFDKIEKIIDIDDTFGKKILEHIIGRNHHPKLVERAKNLLEREKK
jgi:3-methyladenine DNA glycosylase AlkC